MKRNRAERKAGTSSGSTEMTTEVACLNSPELWSLLRYLALDIMTSFELWMDCLRKVRRSFSTTGRTWTGIECIANCIVVGAMVNDSQEEDPVG